MGRPPSKFVTDPSDALKPERKREDFFTRAELVALEQSWLQNNPGSGKEAFYRFGTPKLILGFRQKKFAETKRRG
jgi:hypothetical protein